MRIKFDFKNIIIWGLKSMKTCQIYQLNDNWQLSESIGIELSAHITL